MVISGLCAGNKSKASDPERTCRQFPDRLARRFAARDRMRRIIATLLRALERLGNVFFSQSAVARRALLRTEARERDAMEAERLDRLRNPCDYQGR